MSPMELTTSRIEALQARLSCASSLEMITSHFSISRSRGVAVFLERVVVHVFSWPPCTRRCGQTEVPDKLTLSALRSVTKPAVRLLTCSTGIKVRQRGCYILAKYVRGTQIWHVVTLDHAESNLDNTTNAVVKNYLSTSWPKNNRACDSDMTWPY